MSLKYKDHRVAVFFDIQNLYHSAKNLYQARVNFKEVLKTAVANRKLVRAIGYVVKSETAEGEMSFFEALEKIGIELRTKDLQIFPGGMKKADWDVGMAVDAIRFSPSVDAIVLATGDGDFIPLIEYLRSNGKQIEVISFGRSSSSKLKEVADEFIDLGDNLNKYLIKNKRIFKKIRSQTKDSRERE
jgi:uncharacterized LabA/DUF88 family protein